MQTRYTLYKFKNEDGLVIISLESIQSIQTKHVVDGDAHIIIRYDDERVERITTDALQCETFINYVFECYKQYIGGDDYE